MRADSLFKECDFLRKPKPLFGGESEREIGTNLTLPYLSDRSIFVTVNSKIRGGGTTAPYKTAQIDVQ